MRQFSPATTRQAPVDRNPTKISAHANAAVPGATIQDLAAYTCPASRRAEIRVAFVSGVVTTALAAGQVADLEVLYQDNLPTTHIVVLKRLPTAAPVGTDRDVTVPGFFLAATQAITTRVATSAGAGVIFGAGGLEGVEYDA